MTEEKPEPEEQEAVVEYTTREECVNLSCQAIATVLQIRVEMDVQMMTQADQKRLKRIMSKSLAVLDLNIAEMYAEHTEDDVDED